MRPAIDQIDDLSYDVCFWVDDKIHQWLDEYGGEFVLETTGAPPSHWILSFGDLDTSTFFKLTWL